MIMAVAPAYGHVLSPSLFVRDSADWKDELQDGVTKDVFIRIRQGITRLSGE